MKKKKCIVFLILVAPITAITYPIDKISDGKAQAFNMWLQEFLYEVIIQPFHLLIYVVFLCKKSRKSIRLFKMFIYVL